jgi:LysM repeat protein
MRRHLDMLLAVLAALLIGIGVDAGSVVYASASQTNYGTVLTPAVPDAPQTPVIKTSSVRPESTRTVLVHGLLAQATRYQIVSGDTLSGISGRQYGNYRYWPAIYAANKTTIKNANLIYPGQTISIPARPSSIPSPVTVADREGGAPAPTRSTPVTVVSSSGLRGTLSCGGLEALWMAAGGKQSAAFIAAEIAMAESGGNQFAHSPTNDFGYWQINGVHGALATYDPLGNARAAVSVSGDGSNWNPWTTYTSGAYRGKCSSLTVATKIGIPKLPVSGGSSTSSKELQALSWALTQAGKPYVWGGNGPYGYDCSGLVVAAYSRVGILLPRTTYNMPSSSHLHRTSSPVKGDLVLWFGSGGAFHVEFYINSATTYGAHESGKPISYAGMWSAYHLYYHVS